MTEPYKDQDPMPFGKYKGEQIGDVPASYLLWCFYSSDAVKKYEGLHEYIKRNLNFLKKEAGEQRE